RRPALAKIRPGRPAPAMGPGTVNGGGGRGHPSHSCSDILVTNWKGGAPKLTGGHVGGAPRQQTLGVLEVRALGTLLIGSALALRPAAAVLLLGCRAARAAPSCGQ